MGYNKNPKGYRLYNALTNKVIIRRDVTFNESNFLLNSELKQPDESLEILLIPTESPEALEAESHNNAAPEQQARRSARVHNPPDRFGKWVSCTANCEQFAYNVCQVPEPKTIDEALSGTHAKEWKEAAESEYESLMENNTWDLVELPDGEVSGYSRLSMTVMVELRGSRVA